MADLSRIKYGVPGGTNKIEGADWNTLVDEVWMLQRQLRVLERGLAVVVVVTMLVSVLLAFDAAWPPVVALALAVVWGTGAAVLVVRVRQAHRWQRLDAVRRRLVGSS